ncbi:MAG: hypothetical protein ACP5I2_01910 [Fervidicoccaceae archaeon]
MMWIPRYARRKTRSMLKSGQKVHVGYRYEIRVDDESNLIYIYDKKTRKRHVLLR